MKTARILFDAAKEAQPFGCLRRGGLSDDSIRARPCLVPVTFNYFSVGSMRNRRILRGPICFVLLASLLPGFGSLVSLPTRLFNAIGYF